MGGPCASIRIQPASGVCSNSTRPRARAACRASSRRPGVREHAHLEPVATRAGRSRPRAARRAYASGCARRRRLPRNAREPVEQRRVLAAQRHAVQLARSCARCRRAAPRRRGGTRRPAAPRWGAWPTSALAGPQRSAGSSGRARPSASASASPSRSSPPSAWHSSSSRRSSPSRRARAPGFTPARVTRSGGSVSLQRHERRARGAVEQQVQLLVVERAGRARIGNRPDISMVVSRRSSRACGGESSRGSRRSSPMSCESCEPVRGSSVRRGRREPRLDRHLRGLAGDACRSPSTTRRCRACLSAPLAQCDSRSTTWRRVLSAARDREVLAFEPRPQRARHAAVARAGRDLREPPAAHVRIGFVDHVLERQRRDRLVRVAGAPQQALGRAQALPGRFRLAQRAERGSRVPAIARAPRAERARNGGARIVAHRARHERDQRRRQVVPCRRGRGEQPQSGGVRVRQSGPSGHEHTGSASRRRSASAPPRRACRARGLERRRPRALRRARAPSARVRSREPPAMRGNATSDTASARTCSGVRVSASLERQFGQWGIREGGRVGRGESPGYGGRPLPASKRPARSKGDASLRHLRRTDARFIADFQAAAARRHSPLSGGRRVAGRVSGQAPHPRTRPREVDVRLRAALPALPRRPGRVLGRAGEDARVVPPVEHGVRRGLRRDRLLLVLGRPAERVLQLRGPPPARRAATRPRSSGPPTSRASTGTSPTAS